MKYVFRESVDNVFQRYRFIDEFKCQETDNTYYNLFTNNDLILLERTNFLMTFIQILTNILNANVRLLFYYSFI